MKYTLLSIFVFFTVSAFAQQDVTGGNFTIYGSQDSTLEGDVTVINGGTSTISVKVKRVPQTLVSGSINYFCWAQCYGPSTNVSPTALTLAPGDTLTNFHGYYAAEGNPGTSSIMYVFYDINNTSDSAYVTINFQTSATPEAAVERYIVLNFGTTGVSDLSGNLPYLSLISNPVQEHALFKYNLEGSVGTSKISIYNVLGEKINDLKLENIKGIKSYSTSSLSSGVYFYSLITDNKVISSKKFVVTH